MTGLYDDVFVRLGWAGLVLLGWLLVERRASPVSAVWGVHRGGRVSWGLAVCLTLLGNLPLLRALPALTRSDVPLSGDAASHLAAALSLGDNGFGSAWLPHTHAGFPAFVHYPVVAWLPVIALVKAGVSPFTSVQCVGLLALLVPPFLVLLAARRAGAEPAAAAAAAIGFSLVAPSSSFVGGWEAFSNRGLLAQVVGVAAALWVVVTLMPRSPRWHAPLAGALLAASHPQVGIAALCSFGVSVVLLRERQVTLRYVQALAGAGLMTLAVFGPGLASMSVPFGWPAMERWKVVGQSREYWAQQFLLGEVFDSGGAPILQTAGVLALALCLGMFRRHACRVSCGTAVGALALLLAGPAMESLGKVGKVLLSVLQPMRVAAVLPMVLALVLAVALHELAASLAPWLSRGRWVDRLGQRLVWLPALGLVLLALPSRASFVRESVAARTGEEWSRACGGQPRAGAFRRVSSWLRELGVHRVAEVSQKETMIGGCLRSRPFVDGHPRVMAGNGGVGAHVGLMGEAFSHLALDRPGSARRAETLGVRYALRLATDPALDDTGWETVRRGDGLLLLRRRTGGDLFGAACVGEVWEGSDTALREALFEDLEGSQRVLASPARPIEVRAGTGALTRRSVPDGGCDLTSASIAELSAGVGALRAELRNPAPIDLVLRVTAFHTWRVLVDGVEVPWRKAAPGFPVVRLPPGRHTVVATVSLPRGYVAGVALALLAVVSLALGAERLRGAVQWIGRRRAQ